MTAVSDTAALAAIGAADRELKLPTVRADAARMAEIAVRERATPTGLPRRATVRRGRRPHRPPARRTGQARFPRVMRLADFNPDVIPGIAARNGAFMTSA